MSGLLALAFGAGLLAPVNPCGFGLLPAVLSAAATTNASARGASSRMVSGLRAGVALSVGFCATFSMIGVLLAVGLRSVITLVPWAAAVLGGVLTLVGMAMLAGWQPAVRLPGHRPSPEGATSMGRLVVFGAGYALASASCTLAVLLAVVTQAAATTWIGVLAVFTAYAAGSALVLMTLALFAAATATTLGLLMRRLAPYASRAGGALLALSGAYLLYYWLPLLLGMRRTGVDPVGRLSAVTATWINEHQMGLTMTATVLVVATVAASLVRRPTRTRLFGGQDIVEKRADRR